MKIDLGGEDCGSVAWGAIGIEPCEEEFVPEPGSILLLGSGLAGLAGYATLRDGFGARKPSDVAGGARRGRPQRTSSSMESPQE